ncbi:hypothetical protein BDR26DRAFT_628530 [Obelidium mucronatum]|nr:hypothetical protein BDR26DRAFT_628530 [Obelidium mucronatum]
MSLSQKTQNLAIAVVATLVFIASFLIFLRDFAEGSKKVSAARKEHQSVKTNFKFAQPHLRAAVYYPANGTSEFSVEDLTDLCYLGESLQITKEWAIRGNVDALTENYLGNCYSIEVSASQEDRSLNNCSDLAQYIYHSNARLSIRFDDSVYKSKAQLCPRSTYLHAGKAIQTTLLEKSRKLRNMWIPNDEWNQLPLYELGISILCKTRIACNSYRAYMEKAKIQKGEGANLKYMSHSTPDVRESAMSLLGEKKFKTFMADSNRYNRFYHILSPNRMNTTEELLHCWAGKPRWPKLTIVAHHAKPHELIRNETSAFEQIPRNIQILSSVAMTKAKLRELQVRNGIHLCPSQHEGYGHFINEARALESLVMTTHYPPMEELVEDGVSGVLVDHDEPMAESNHALQKYLVPPVRVPASSICAAVERVLKMDIASRKQMGRKAREAFEWDTKIMKDNLNVLVKEADDFLHR